MLEVSYSSYLFQGLIFILYPLIGLLADNKLTCYQIICLSCWILFIGIFSIVAVLISTNSVSYENISLEVGALLVVAIAIVDKGMFESTVIQFGTDQMIEAPLKSTQYIHTLVLFIYC